MDDGLELPFLEGVAGLSPCSLGLGKTGWCLVKEIIHHIAHDGVTALDAAFPHGLGQALGNGHDAPCFPRHTASEPAVE